MDRAKKRQDRLGPSDEELLAAWRGGEERAGAEIFKRHHDSIARFFMNKLGVEGTDDLVQRTFLGLLKGLSHLGERARVRTVLFAIARKQLCWYLRNLVRDRERFDPDHTSLAALGPSPTQVLAEEERDLLLLRALRELPLSMQIMFELRYWEGMEPKEIAAVLDIPGETVRTRFRRGRQKLEEHIRNFATSKEELERSLGGLATWAAELRDLEG